MKFNNCYYISRNSTIDIRTADNYNADKLMYVRSQNIYSILLLLLLYHLDLALYETINANFYMLISTVISTENNFKCSCKSFK